MVLFGYINIPSCIFMDAIPIEKQRTAVKLHQVVYVLACPLFHYVQ